ncbi:MAG: hypothetical protein R2771_01455 [Saprospiraceae bacterium]
MKIPKAFGTDSDKKNMNIVDLSHLAQGLYFCVFMDGNRMLQVEKVVKSKK